MEQSHLRIDRHRLFRQFVDKSRRKLTLQANAPNDQNAGPEKVRRLCVYNGGFLKQTRLRRILSLSGYQLRLGFPRQGEGVAVWGKSPTAYRGEAIAARFQAPLIRIEDAFWRSLHPARLDKSPPLGLIIDHKTVHFDPSIPSDLEELLATHPLNDPALMTRARHLLARVQESGLSKYSAFDPNIPPPKAGYILVIDQTYGDAAVKASGADQSCFLTMLQAAQDENPNARILIKTHPETKEGLRQGYFTDAQNSDRITLYDAPINPWTLLSQAAQVYVVSSQMGFEAILAGHKPRVFGQPFYAGWGLSLDEYPIKRRQRQLTATQLFAAAMLLYPKWYDIYNDRLCRAEEAAESLIAQTRAWQEDNQGWVASEMRLWKRRPLQKIYGQHRRIIFENNPQKASKINRPWMVWAGKATQAHDGAIRVEDGFIRSRGLGAELVPPLSLVTDDIGIYYDPNRPSRLEQLIAKRRTLRPDQITRVKALMANITQNAISKYNLENRPINLPKGPHVLVVGQVEDDASILYGAGEINTNEKLLQAARKAHPDAVLIYKPHPDVQAGLRKGSVNANGLADIIAENTDITTLFDHASELWSMTSLAGFEALCRGIKVTTTGSPFYAGWGLTRDLGNIPERRNVNVPLEGLVHAALIDYPRYFDPKTGLPCSVEVVIDRLSNETVMHPAPLNRLLAKLQGAFSSYAHLWR